MSVPLPIPLNLTLKYFFMPYKVQSKIYCYEVFVQMSDTILDVKQQIAQ